MTILTQSPSLVAPKDSAPFSAGLVEDLEALQPWTEGELQALFGLAAPTLTLADIHDRLDALDITDEDREILCRKPLPLPAEYEPTDADRRWWAEVGSLDVGPSDFDLWLDEASPEPELAPSGEFRDFGDQYLGAEGGAL